MKKVYFVRHGESIANLEQTLYGKEVRLSPHGYAQAEAVAERTRLVDIDELVVSDFVRAQETIAPIARVKNLEPVVEPAFGEIYEPSKYNGLGDNGPEIKQWRKVRNAAISDPDFDAEDGENWFQIHKRTQIAKQFLENREAESILVVSHALYTRYLIAALLFNKAEPNKDLFEFMLRTKISNTAISLMTYEEDFGWKLLLMNDHAHFAE